MLSIVRRSISSLYQLRWYILTLALGIFVLVALTACSPFYVFRAAYEEGKILLAREDITDVVKDEATSQEEREKLKLVLDARQFAIDIGLTPKNSFTKYSKVDRDILAWVVLGSKPTAFELYTWWYPIVGTVPYKGYFDKDSAECAAKDLEEKGYETWVRGTEAISTLGWFNDPILSTTLRHPSTRVANTVIHETFHSTVWVPDHVDFNESAANFVGIQGALDYFVERSERCATDDAKCVEEAQTLVERAREDREYELQIGDLITQLYQDLKDLYESDQSEEYKKEQRSVIFHKHLDPLHQQYPKMRILRKINNAEIMQLKLYLTKLRDFEKLYFQCEKKWACFFEAIRQIQSEVEDNDAQPFEALQGILQKN